MTKKLWYKPCSSYVAHHNFNGRFIFTILIFFSSIFFVSSISHEQLLAQTDSELLDQFTWKNSTFTQIEISLEHPINWTISPDANTIKITHESGPYLPYIETINIINHGSPSINNLKTMASILLKQCMDKEHESPSGYYRCDITRPVIDSPFLVDSEPAKIFETSNYEKKVATSAGNSYTREIIVTFHDDQMYEIQIAYDSLPEEYSHQKTIFKFW